MTPTIRRAKPADAPDLVAVIKAAYAPFLAEGLELPPVADGIAKDIADHDVWVAVTGGSIVGGLVMSGDHIMNLAVHPDAGGQGIGQLLIAKAKQSAKTAGHATIHLATHAGMKATVRFYQRLGWAISDQQGNKISMSSDI